MSRMSTVLMTSTLGVTDVTGDTSRAAGYFGNTSGLHTVAIYVAADMTGEVYVEGSLATSPTSSDWFPIKLDGVNDYITYTTATSDVDHYTFNSNIIWVRARVANQTAGSLDKILISF